MKKILLFVLLLLPAGYILAADFNYCDFETTDLNFKTNNNLTYEVVANPVSGGINTSAHVGKVISAGGKWELIYSDVMEKFIDFDDSKVFKMKVYSPRAGVPVYFKVEGGATPVEVTTVVTTKVNEWEELVFDFTDLNPQTMVYNKFVLLFDAGYEGSGETFYFDDITGPDAVEIVIPETRFVTYCNFEDTLMTFVQANTQNDMQYEVVENPYQSGINTSSHCGKLVTTEDNWELLVSDVLPEAFDFATYGYKFTMKVYAPVAGDVYFKVENTEGTANKEAKLYCPAANNWIEMEFDFADLLPASGVMTKIILLFDANSALAGNTWYFDDIRGPGDNGEAPSGIPVFTSGDGLVYPNPASDILYFRRTLSAEQVSIISLQGQVLYSETVNGGMIDLAGLDLNQGMYIIKVGKENSCFIKE